MSVNFQGVDLTGVIVNHQGVVIISRIETSQSPVLSIVTVNRQSLFGFVMVL